LAKTILINLAVHLQCSHTNRGLIVHPLFVIFEIFLQCMYECIFAAKYEKWLTLTVDRVIAVVKGDTDVHCSAEVCRCFGWYNTKC